MRVEDLLNLLEPYNPWWDNNSWHQQDSLIRNYESSILKREPRLFHHFKKYLVKKNCYGILTVRGPRRVGKSTLTKLIIKYLIDMGINPKNIFYISLDYGGLSTIPLLDVLRVIGENQGDKYIFLDEASMHPDWALVLKNAHDIGLIENGKLKIVATGSHSMDLAEAASKLRDRQGCLAKQFNVGGNFIHTPLRFPEVVEALRDEIDKYLVKHKLRRPAARFKALTELDNGNIPQVLQDLYSDYFQLIQNTFESYLNSWRLSESHERVLPEKLHKTRFLLQCGRIATF